MIAMGLDHELEQLLAFYQIDEKDYILLRELRPLLRERGDQLVETLRAHLLPLEEPAQHLRDTDHFSRMKTRHRERLSHLGDPVDLAYAEDRLEESGAHARAGVPLRWFLAAHSLYAKTAVEMVWEQLGDDPERARESSRALSKLLSLDAQLALEAYIEQREEELRTRNAELTEARRQLKSSLQATVLRAQEAERRASLATLIAGLAHEIGTPMNIIQGYAEMLDSSVADEEGRKRLHVIRKQIDRIAGVMKALLNMAKPSKMRHEQIRLGPIIQSSLNFLDENLKKQNIHPIVEFDSNLDVRGDPGKLEQLFINLFLNASDAMPEGGELRVQVEKGNDEVVISIGDTGTGIRGEILARIFEPFFTTKDASLGNGLGLSVVKGIVEDHGGTIDVGSKVGKGTTFRITLPRL